MFEVNVLDLSACRDLGISTQRDERGVAAIICDGDIPITGILFRSIDFIDYMIETLQDIRKKEFSN
jgi:hypothetical protein